MCGKQLSIDQFLKTAWGYSHVCKECAKASRQRTKNNKEKLANCEKMVEEARRERIQSFKARELMAELHRRGYEGQLTFTRTVTDTIDISKIK